MSVAEDLKNMLNDLKEKKFIEKDDYEGLINDLNYFSSFKQKYEFKFEEKSISDYFDENNKNKIKNILVVIGQENLGKTYFIKLLNSELSKKKQLITEEIDYKRNEIKFKIINNEYLIARINLNPIFSKSEEEKKIFEYFKYSNLLLNYANKIFYITNDENFNLDNIEYKNEINEQLIYFNFDVITNENKFVIVKNLFYNNGDNTKPNNKNSTNKNNIVEGFTPLNENIPTQDEIIFSSELFENLKKIKSFLEKKKLKDNNNNNKNEQSIILFNTMYKDIANYYLNRYDFSRQLNNCNVDYNYGINNDDRLMFYIEVPEEYEYKIDAKSIELDNYVLISIVGEIDDNIKNNNENIQKKFEIYENIKIKNLEKLYSIKKKGESKQIKEERAYLVTF